MTTATTVINTRFDSETLALLDALCERPGQPRVSRSEAIRWAVRQLADRELQQEERIQR